MESIAIKRIQRDLQILKNNKDDLMKRGIYFYVNEANLMDMFFLIVPKEKKEGVLISPYTGGNFLFQMTFPNDFPLSPPKTIFYPQQKTCRLHPNYYPNGKVCLSVINTWAQNDWSPSTSVMTLLSVLEERFNENAVCFEPGREMTAISEKINFNNVVEIAKYKVCILDILKGTTSVFKPFKEEIIKEFNLNKEYLIERLENLKSSIGEKGIVVSRAYADYVKFDINETLKALRDASLTKTTKASNE